MHDNKMKSFQERVLFIFGCGLIITFFSEFFFFNEGPVEELNAGIREPHLLAPKLLELGIWYLLTIAPAILLMAYFRTSNIWSIFLAGAFAGYCIEGLVVPPLYLELPISIIWTSASWHPIVDIIFGLWIWQKWLRERGILFNLCICTIMGMVWALWSTWPVGFPSEVTEEIVGFTDMAEYAGFLFASTTVLFIGNLLTTFRASKTFIPAHIDFIVFGITSLCLFIAMAIMVSFLAILLPILLFLCYLPLRYGKKQDDEQTIIALFETAPSYLNQATVWAMPVSALCTYWILQQQNWHLEAWVLGSFIMIAGVVFAILAPIKLLRR